MLLKTSLQRAMVAHNPLMRTSVRCFGAEAKPQPGKASGRMHGNPGWYNKRFEPSQGKDANYVDYAAYFRGASGFEPR